MFCPVVCWWPNFVHWQEFAFIDWYCESELTIIVSWLNAHKMSSNIEKNLIWYSDQGTRNWIQVTILSSMVAKVNRFKPLNSLALLFIVIWHISYVCSNISKNIGILIKPIKVFDTNTLLTLCYIFIYPYLNYCVHLWGSTYDTYVNKIFLLWKKVVHITHGINLRAPNEPLFSSLYVLSVRMYTCIILDFLCMNTIMDYWQIYSTCSNKTWIYAWSFRLQMHVHMWFRWWGHHAVRLRLCFCLFK